MTSIYGVGVDQVNLDRVRKLLSKNKSKFETRCFTKNEILYANRFNDPSKRLGARFAGKEAVMKSLGKLIEYPEGRGWARDVNFDGSLSVETISGEMINLTSPLISEVK
ncbi:4'-phosphopantetheinyl transferase superfamily protein [Acidimicrobiia bacterium]|nr:4'-phosphopantetheinyl transferase superfamily protein [Acidimicrobiia bacterium]